MPTRYSLALRLLHWIIAIAIIGLLIVGIYMEGLPHEAPNKYEFYGIHKAIGVLTLLAVALRVLVRWRSHIPTLPDTIKRWEKLAAKLGHYALYGFMFAMPMSGIVMSQAGGHAINVFGWVMPVFIEKNKALGGIAHEVHELAGYGLIVMLVLHVGAVVKHRLLDKVNLLPRMGFGK